MVKTKKMDESRFAKLVKEFNALGELVRARQDEKQSLSDEFDKESSRFSKGQISQKTLMSSIQKTNKEYARIDQDVRKTIAKAADFAVRAKKFTADQSPKNFKATLTGVKDVTGKKNKAGTKKKAAAKKAAKAMKVIKKAAKKVAKKSAKKIVKK